MNIKNRYFDDDDKLNNRQEKQIKEYKVVLYVFMFEKDKSKDLLRDFQLIKFRFNDAFAQLQIELLQT